MLFLDFRLVAEVVRLLPLALDIERFRLVLDEIMAHVGLLWFCRQSERTSVGKCADLVLGDSMLMIVVLLRGACREDFWVLGSCWRRAVQRLADYGSLALIPVFKNRLEISLFLLCRISRLYDKALPFHWSDAEIVLYNEINLR